MTVAEEQALCLLKMELTQGPWAALGRIELGAFVEGPVAA